MDNNDSFCTFFAEENVMQSFFPRRLYNARVAKRLNQRELAEEIGLTRQSISAFELGVRRPDGKTLFQLAKVLEQPISYFGKKTEDEFSPIGPRFFRSFGPKTKLRNDQCKVYSEWFSMISSYFLRFVNFPCEKLPDYSPMSSDGFFTKEEIEDAAINVRETFGLGNGPIDNLLSLLESKGIFISHFPISKDKVDAFSFWSGDRPFIILSLDDISATRARFDLAHELAHLVLHKGIDESELENKEFLNRIEQEANQFAGAFLLPRGTYINEVFTSRLDSFVQLKRRWKVSISAQIYRCDDLGLFSEQQVLNLYKQISARRWRTNEPLDDVIPLESPSLFKKAVELLVNNKILNYWEIIQSINLNEKIINTFCNLPDNLYCQDVEVIVNPVLKKHVNFNDIEQPSSQHY